MTAWRCAVIMLIATGGVPIAGCGQVPDRKMDAIDFRPDIAASELAAASGARYPALGADPKGACWPSLNLIDCASTLEVR